jgi:hypothetical protein
METYRIRQFLGGTVGLCDHSIKVFDHTEAITAEGKIVGHVSTTTITKIKRLLAVEWRSRIGIRDCLFEQRKEE